MTRVVLTARGRPVGLLAMAGAAARPHDWELLHTYANQAALAIERSQLRDQAVRAELLEEVDRLRDALMGAVSHDLRTPLASIKTAVSTLRGAERRPGAPPTATSCSELIEDQSDAPRPARRPTCST